MPRIHRHRSRPEHADVNAYLVEGDSGVVAVDGTLTVSEGRALRRRLDEIGKPLLAILITHAHPDHYGGVVEFSAGHDVPILATEAVDRVIRRDDPVKESILRPMFGDEWPRQRAFPNRIAADGERFQFDDLSFTVIDLGPGESPADSIWLLGDDRTVAFPGDPVYGRMHAYLADGFYEEWRANIGRLRSELDPAATLHIGHGAPASPADFDWQLGYIDAFVTAVGEADWSDRDEARRAVGAAMTDYLPAEDLRFLMELSIEPMAARLGLIDGPAG